MGWFSRSKNVSATGAVKPVPGRSRFWRCPNCKGVLQKNRPISGFDGFDSVQLGVSCGGCGKSFSGNDVYGGKYDLPEVEVACPKCKSEFKGPAEELLGKPCMDCGTILPVA